MLHKAFIVLFTCAHSLGLEFGGKGTESIIHGTTDYSACLNTDDNIFCPETILTNGRYGDFFFPKTKAAVGGVQVRVECKYGFRNNGFLPFTIGQNQTTEDKEAMSGAIRTCAIVKNEDGCFTGEWQPKGEVKINDCKELGWDVTVRTWNHIVEVMTPTIFISSIPLMQDVLIFAYADYDCAVPLINGIDLLLRNPSLGPENISKEDRDQVFIVLDSFTKQMADILIPGFKTHVGDGGIIVETAKFPGMHRFYRTTETEDLSLMNIELQPYHTNFTTLNETTVDVDISIEALFMSMEKTNGKDPQLKITAYSADVFKAWSETGAPARSGRSCFPDSNVVEPEQCSDDNSSTSETLKPWGLLTIELDGEIQNLTEPIEFVIVYNGLLEGERMKCVFWDESAKQWSNDGLTTTHIPGGVKCKSTHLTAFSALIEPLPLPFPGGDYVPTNDVHRFILSVLSSIGSVCSIVGLSFTLLTYGLFRSLRRERSNRILINLSLSLLLMHIMSISASKSLWAGYCFVPAASLHYLVLTSLAWMMVEAVHMFELLISVFVRPENRFLVKRLVLAWGIPLVIVVVCAVMNSKVYKDGRGDLCLMSPYQNTVSLIIYYGAYIGPICVMLLVNMIIFGRVFRVLYQQTKRTKGPNSGKDVATKYQFVKISPSQIKGALSVLVLLGIGWILGLLAMGPFELLFKYMNCVCNAGQGLFIFIFRVLLNPHASKLWKKFILGLSSDSSFDTSFTTSTSTGSGRGKKRKSTMISPTFISASNSVENSLTPSNPLSASLAKTLASILKSQDFKNAAFESGNENMN